MDASWAGPSWEQSGLLMKDDQVSEEREGMKDNGGESDLPYGHGLWSSGCPGEMARGSSLMALVGLSPNLVRWPSFGRSSIFSPCQ